MENCSITIFQDAIRNNSITKNDFFLIKNINFVYNKTKKIEIQKRSIIGYYIIKNRTQF